MHSDKPSDHRSESVNSSTDSSVIPIGLVVILYAGLLFWSCNFPFFWDTIQLGAKQAFHFYDNGLSMSLLPDHINSGHIPAFGFYLAICWSIFGKSLIVSHLAMSPFVFITMILIWKLLSGSISSQIGLSLSILVCILDPTLLTQFLMVSPDIVLICGFLAVLYGHQVSVRWLQVIGFMLLTLISIRGIYLAGLLGIWMLMSGKSLKSLIGLAIPSVVIVLMYYISHYLSLGWVGVHSDSPWQSSISLTHYSRILRNIGIMGWRLIDFGRIVPAAVAGYLAWKHRSVLKEGPLRSYGLLLIILLLGYLLLTTPFVGLTGHRYYLPLILTGLILLCLLVSKCQLTLRTSTAILSLILLTQLLSHQIIYPDSISQGWDSSLAHVPYFDMVDEVESYLQSNDIRCDQVGTYFPLRGESRYRDLEDRQCTYPPAMIGIDRYIIGSNVLNDLKPNAIVRLQSEYNIVKQWQQGGVYMRLYQMKQ